MSSTLLTSNDEMMFALALRGGYNQFTKYYFDWVPLPNQYLSHYAVQPNLIHLGGVGSGKTMGQAMSFLTKALTTPYYLGLNTSISSFQAKLLFEKLQPYVQDGGPIERFIKDVRTRPYPMITTVFESQIACMTAGHQAQLIRGSEWDEINGDEFGYERYEDTVWALRGRLRGKRPDGTYRLAKLKITTTPTDSEWLRKWWDRGDKDSGSAEYNPQRYLSIRSTLFDNIHIPEWQREEIMAGYTQEMIQQEIMALFPDWGDKEFPVKFIDACEDVSMNDTMELLINPIIETEDGEVIAGTPVEGASLIEVPRTGVVRWEMPYDPTRFYILASDPGTSSPPKRNSPVVIVLDATDVPYQLAFFHWVSGNGSYMPWLNSFKYALAKYRPLLKGIDATGPQKALDELVFEREGISVDAVNFARDKDGMLVALKLLLQNHELRFPYIKGFRNQVRNYKVPDKGLRQDIVSALMVAAYLVRFLPDRGSRKTTVIRSPASYHRRSRRRLRRAPR